MTGSSLSTQQTSIPESLGPRGLSTKQQNEIAAEQSRQATYQSQQRRRSSGSTSLSQSSSLYVGELDPFVDEAMLMDVFINIGPVESIRLCRDAITNESLGYAYVQFTSDTDGTRAIQQLNYALIHGKPCRIMWTRTDANRPKTTTGNIFIKNLDPSITTKSLLDTFSLYGHITSCKIVTDEQGRSKGYGFIHYDTPESAERAINYVNGMTLYDREIFVGHHIPKQERIQRIEEAKQRFTNVYVKNLVTDITEEELKELFGGFGPIGSVLIQRDDQGHSRGFGFVNFERHEDAEKAVAQMHETEYIGKRLFVSRAQRRSEREEELRKQHDQSRHEKASKYHGVNLYVKNLAESVDDNVLRDTFAKYGTITSARVMRDDKTSHSKGFGFVCFNTPEEAGRAVAEMNGKSLIDKTIYVALAQKKEDRRHQLEAQLTHQRTSQIMHLQQAFVPVPINAYMNSGPIFYESYPQHSYPSAPPLSQQPGVMTPRPAKWNPAAPSPMMKQGYVTGPVPYPNFAAAPPHVRPTTHQMYDNDHLTSPPLPHHNIQHTATSPTSSQSIHVSSSRPTDESTPNRMTNTTGKDTIADENHNSRADDDDSEDIPLDSLEDYSLEMQKQMIGERIYKIVNIKYSNIAAKVTGMLLEMDVEDLLYLIKNEPLLQEKTQEAVNVLKQHQQGNADQDGLDL